MASWDEIREHLRSTFNVVRDEPHAVALSWSAKIGEGEIVQGFGLAPMTVAKRPWLTMIAEIAIEDGFPLPTAMLYQDRLPLGGLVLRNGMYLLRHGVALDSITLGELDWTIRLLAQEAARMRVNLFARKPSGDAFANYED